MTFELGLDDKSSMFFSRRYVLISQTNVLIDPIQVVRHLRVHARSIGLRAPVAPADDPVKVMHTYVHEKRDLKLINFLLFLFSLFLFLSNITIYTPRSPIIGHIS